MAGAPKFYRSMEEFEREEIKPHTRLGFSLDDLYTDTNYASGAEESSDDGGPAELDFGRWR